MKRLTFVLIIASLILTGWLPAQDFRSINSDQTKFFSGLSDTLDALNYEIHISQLDFTAKTISAKTIATIESKVDNLSAIKLELLDVTVDEVSVDGEIIAGFQHQSPFLHIPLNNSISMGQIIQVEVNYHGVPFHEGWGGFH